MLIRSSVVEAAEKRRPLDATRSISLESAVAAKALLPNGSSTATTGVDFSLAKRATNLTFAGAKPSSTELERLMGTNDLVDEFYLQRALFAARPVMRITLRDAASRERGWATGFMVSPRLLLTNWHVFPSREETSNAIAEANYVLDIAGDPAPSYRFSIRGDQFYIADEHLDFALVAVDPTSQDGRTPLSQFGYHRLIAEPNKIRVGESMTLIQHPGGERRQFAIRENQLSQILDEFLWYQSDTAPGSSGAPAFNDSFQVVALHHSGAAKRDEAGRYQLRDGTTIDSLDGVDESKIDWVANEGLRISVLCSFLRAHLQVSDPFAMELFQSMQTGDVMSKTLGQAGAIPLISNPKAAETVALSNSPNSSSLTIPLQVQISLSLVGSGEGAPVLSYSSHPPVAVTPSAPSGAEALRFPIVDRNYTTRTGYDPNFLGVIAPLPKVTDASLVSRMADGSHEIPYEHFTVVVNKRRRLPLFTACNADYALSKRQPEPGDYSRKALTGLGPNDQEKWLTDPRIPQQDQLPDVFYTQDGGSFDKGHVVRRDDMCWGNSREQIVRANGDTFHVTNCTPQIAGFNRSVEGENNWGDLENEIQRQVGADKVSLFAGPILADDDRVFAGKDDFGAINIQVPHEYWKVILVNDSGNLAAYAFILQQDLHNVPEEFRVTATWAPYLVPLSLLESRLSGLTFAPQIHSADRASRGGQELANIIGVKAHASLAKIGTI